MVDPAVKVLLVKVSAAVSITNPATASNPANAVKVASRGWYKVEWLWVSKENPVTACVWVVPETEFVVAEVKDDGVPKEIVLVAAIVPPPDKPTPAEIETLEWSICSFATKLVNALWSMFAWLIVNSTLSPCVASSFVTKIVKRELALLILKISVKVSAPAVLVPSVNWVKAFFA